MTTKQEQTADLQLSEGQKVLLAIYCNGEFNHLAELKTQEELQSELAQCGDGLLRYLMIELARSEDCDTADEALARVEASIRDLDQVRAALVDRIEEQNESSVLSIIHR